MQFIKIAVENPLIAYNNVVHSTNISLLFRTILYINWDL